MPHAASTPRQPAASSAATSSPTAAAAAPPACATPPPRKISATTTTPPAAPPPAPPTCAKPPPPRPTQPTQPTQPPTPASPADPATSTFLLPLPEDRSAIQHAIGQVLQRIASNTLDPRRAGLLLYGLQIASLNLKQVKQDNKNATPEDTVAEITLDPIDGPLAPTAELGTPKSPAPPPSSSKNSSAKKNNANSARQSRSCPASQSPQVWMRSRATRKPPPSGPSRPSKPSSRRDHPSQAVATLQAVAAPASFRPKRKPGAPHLASEMWVRRKPHLRRRFITPKVGGSAAPAAYPRRPRPSVCHSPEQSRTGNLLFAIRMRAPAAAAFAYCP